MNDKVFSVTSTLRVNDEVSVWTWTDLDYADMWKFERGGVDFLERMVKLGEQVKKGLVQAVDPDSPRFTVTSHLSIKKNGQAFYEGGGTWFDVPQVGVSFIKDALSKEVPLQHKVKKVKTKA